MVTKYAEIFKKAPAWMYKIGAQTYIDKVYPRHLFLEVTASCNLSCDYCPREKINKHMDFNLFKSIIDEATTYGPRSFSLHLFGEPLLYPKIWEAISYIKKKNKKHTILLTSNGTLFERFISELTESSVDKVIWSWRPEAKFSEVTKERLRRWGKLTVRMIDGEIPEEARKEWVNWPSIETRNLHNYGGNIKTSSVPPKIRWSCYHLWMAPAVNWQGKFLMCCADPHVKEVFGDINTETVSIAWQRVEKVRQSHLRGEYEGICKDCDVWKSYPDLFFKFQRT